MLSFRALPGERPFELVHAELRMGRERRVELGEHVRLLVLDRGQPTQTAREPERARLGRSGGDKTCKGDKELLPVRIAGSEADGEDCSCSARKTCEKDDAADEQVVGDAAEDDTHERCGDERDPGGEQDLDCRDHHPAW
jgi:hypothetical protein